MGIIKSDDSKESFENNPKLKARLSLRYFERFVLGRLSVILISIVFTLLIYLPAWWGLVWCSKHMSPVVQQMAKLSIFALTGSALFVMSIYLLWRNWMFLQRGIRVEGKVIGESRPESDAEHPVVLFKDLEGRSHVVKSKAGSNYEPKKGSPMKVCYNPNNPKDVILGSLFINWVKNFLMGCTSAAVLSYVWICFRQIFPG